MLYVGGYVTSPVAVVQYSPPPHRAMHFPIYLCLPQHLTVYTITKYFDHMDQIADSEDSAVVSHKHTVRQRPRSSTGR